MGFKCCVDDVGPTGNQGFITRPELTVWLLFGIDDTATAVAAAAAAADEEQLIGWFCRKFEDVTTPLFDTFPAPFPAADPIAV